VKTIDAMKNEALYWRAFAYLATRGKRTLAAWNTMVFAFSVAPPTNQDVADIMDEASRACRNAGQPDEVQS